MVGNFTIHTIRVKSLALVSICLKRRNIFKTIENTIRYQRRKPKQTNARVLTNNLSSVLMHKSLPDFTRSIRILSATPGEKLS
jgi:hypothetical protein